MGMPRLHVKRWTVHVFRPNGYPLIRFTEFCTRHDVAINRAKTRIYKQGRLAHFYTYVAVSEST
jgi:hypothetical protein